MTIIKLATPSKRSAVFLDRDGVINVEVNYCHEIATFKFVPGVLDALKLLQQQFDFLFVVTNQAGIARGYYTEEQFCYLTEWMQEQLKKEGIHIKHVYYCPHHPSGLPPYNIECECRKPKAGMLLKAIAEHNIDPALSILLGDKRSDLEAASGANLSKAYLMGTGHAVNDDDIAKSDAYFESMDQLITFLNGNRQPL